jgi:hypothetical protein
MSRVLAAALWVVALASFLCKLINEHRVMEHWF